MLFDEMTQGRQPLRRGLRAHAATRGDLRVEQVVETGVQRRHAAIPLKIACGSVDP